MYDGISVQTELLPTSVRLLQLHGPYPIKRNIVSLVGRFYDPLVILSPVVVRFKMFVQELCVAKLDWDQPLSADLLGRWNSEGQPGGWTVHFNPSLLFRWRYQKILFLVPFVGFVMPLSRLMQVLCTCSSKQNLGSWCNSWQPRLVCLLSKNKPFPDSNYSLLFFCLDC